MDYFKSVAQEILHWHGQATENLRYLDAGEQSACYGSGALVVLIDRGQTPQEANDYRLQQWLTLMAASVGASTPQILAVGDRPRPYALMQRAPGIRATAHQHTVEDEAAWFYRMGEEIGKINHVHTEGFGVFRPCGTEYYRGRYATWSDYLDAQSERYLFLGHSSNESRQIKDLFLAQGIISPDELEKIAVQLHAAKSWPVQSVLTHYDNRLANLMVDEEQITLLDWGLAFAGIGVKQELIKLFEYEPYSLDNPRVAAFLQGYGLANEAYTDVIEGGKLMLILDGLSMSYEWATESVNSESANSGETKMEARHLEGIRAWLHTIKQICDEW